MSDDGCVPHFGLTCWTWHGWRVIQITWRWLGQSETPLLQKPNRTSMNESICTQVSKTKLAVGRKDREEQWSVSTDKIRHSHHLRFNKKKKKKSQAYWEMTRATLKVIQRPGQCAKKQFPNPHMRNKQLINENLCCQKEFIRLQVLVR